MDVEEQANFQVIELHQLNKKLFFPLSAAGSLAVHVTLYPLTLLRTRLQLQEGNTIYRGLSHCFRSVLAEEGFRGLYSGFWVKNVQVISSVMYVYTYERVRAETSTFHPAVRSFLGGGCASMLAQTLLVPVDIVSQHLMLLANTSSRMTQARSLTPVILRDEEYRNALTRFTGVVRCVHHRHGLRGFYQGYFISLAHFVPNSGLWWGFYNMYCDMFNENLGSELPRLAVQLMSAPCAGVSSGLIMNPVDVVRVRMQVDNTNLSGTIGRLWREDGISFVMKGLSARLLQSALFSSLIVLSYESIKRISLKEEYKDHISW